MFNTFYLNPIMGPNQFLFKFAQHPFQFLNIGRVFLAIVTLADYRNGCV